MAYKGSVARIEKLSRLVLVAVTLVLAGFLVALGTRVLDDVDGWMVAPRREAFDDPAALEAARRPLAALDQQLQGLEEARAVDRKSLEKAQRQYEAQKQSYDDWLQARSAIGSSEEDAEVRGRARALDRYRQIEESWQARLEELDAKAAPLQRQREESRERLEAVEREAGARYGAALRRYELRLFLVRLGIALPILVAAVWLFVRHRRSRYWPIVWAVLVFALYVFFVGLVPYLPSFGGYIRLVVGVILSLLAAFAVVRQLQRYLQRKREELAASARERAAGIPPETALQAFRSHSCPSCERDFLLDRWSPKVRGPGEVRTTAEAPAFCPFCGLPLFGPCPACRQRNFLHFPHCASCGEALAPAGSGAPPP